MPRVLFVDDEAMVLRGLSRVLSCEYDLSVAYSAAEAEALLEGPRGFDVVVTDIQMPECDGIAFIQRVAPRRPYVRFIVLTGNADERALKSASEIPQVTHVLRKPASRDQLVDAIEAAPVATSGQAASLPSGSGSPGSACSP